jgi:hypothetical protein
MAGLEDGRVRAGKGSQLVRTGDTADAIKQKANQLGRHSTCTQSRIAG